MTSATQLLCCAVSSVHMRRALCTYATIVYSTPGAEALANATVGFCCLTVLLHACTQARDSAAQQAALLPGNLLNGPALLRPVPPRDTKALTWFSKREALLRFDAKGKLAGAYSNMTDAAKASGLPSWHREKLVNAMKSSHEQLAYDSYWLVLTAAEQTSVLPHAVALLGDQITASTPWNSTAAADVQLCCLDSNSNKIDAALLLEQLQKLSSNADDDAEPVTVPTRKRKKWGSDDDTQLMAAVVALTPAGATTVPTDTGFWSKVKQQCKQATASRDAESVKRHYQRQLVGTYTNLLPCGTAKPAAKGSGKKRRAAAAAAALDSSDSDCDVRHYGN
jgi:hypothetical protein